MMGAGGLKAFGGAVEGEGRQRKREGDSGGTTSTKPCRESLSAGRTVITGHGQRKPDWGKRQRYSNCRVAALNITATSPSCSTGHESRVPDQCTGTQCQGRSSHAHQQSPHQARWVSTGWSQGPHRPAVNRGSMKTHNTCIFIQHPVSFSPTIRH